MTKLVLDNLDIPDRWYEIALAKAAPLMRVLLTKSNGSHVTHKYVMKKPDGKGGWIYYYRRENGELYTSGETPKRDVNQWLITIRGARSRLNAQIAAQGGTPTPAQKARQERLAKEWEHAKKLKASGQTHAEDLPHKEDGEKKPPATKPETRSEAKQFRDQFEEQDRKDAEREKSKSKRTTGAQIRDDFEAEGKNVMESWDLPIGEQLAFYEKKATSLREIKKRVVAWINEGDSRTEMDRRREDANDIFAAADRVEATLRRVRGEYEKNNANTAADQRTSEMKRTADAHAEAAADFSREMSRNGDISSKSYEKLSGLYSRAATQMENYAKTQHERTAIAQAREATDWLRSQAKEHADKARMAAERESGPSGKSVASDLKSPAYNPSDKSFEGHPDTAGTVFKHEGKDHIWLATNNTGPRNNKPGGILVPIAAHHGDFAVHGEKGSWTITHIPTGMKAGHEEKLADAKAYTQHMHDAGVKAASEDPKAIFGMGSHGKSPVTMDMRKLGDAARAWKEKQVAEKVKKIEATKQEKANRPEAKVERPSAMPYASGQHIDWLSRNPYAATTAGIEDVTKESVKNLEASVARVLGRADYSLGMKERELNEISQRAADLRRKASYASNDHYKRGQDAHGDAWVEAGERYGNIIEAITEHKNNLNESQAKKQEAAPTKQFKKLPAESDPKETEHQKGTSESDPERFAEWVGQDLSRIKKIDDNIESMRMNYKGTGSKKHRRQIYVHFKDSTPPVDVWIEAGHVKIGGVLGGQGIPPVKTTGKSVADALNDVSHALHIYQEVHARSVKKAQSWQPPKGDVPGLHQHRPSLKHDYTSREPDGKDGFRYHYGDESNAQRKKLKKKPKPHFGAEDSKPEINNESTFDANAKGSETMQKPHDYPAHIRKSFRLEGPDPLSKGLYKFAPYNGKAMPKIDEEYLPAYLDAFIEEAYEHECNEKAHGENTMGRVGDMADYWATFVWHELVSYMPSNPNLERACKKLSVNSTYVAQRIRDLNLLTPQNDYTTTNGSFMGGYMESEIATAGLVKSRRSVLDDVFAASEQEQAMGSRERAMLSKSERDFVHLESDVDPMVELRKGADARDAALGSLYGTDDAFTVDPSAGRNWFDQ